ncbi:hypothetical protein PFMALIP_06270, partial [Plasmodium falciparum MaliPS096_E11]
MGPTVDGGGSSQDAKHVLDEFGKQVYDEIVKNGGADAENYIEALKGQLSLATLLGGESASSPNPCNLESEYTKLINGSGSGSGVAARGHPCGSASDKRFSKERVSKYDEKKIGCSNSEGACAPFRRLSLCNKNFQKINNDDSTNAKHNLLLDVCLAANHEGQSIKTYRDQYDAEYPSGSGHTTCTMLARSFADIGDIVRGRDLYGGNKKKEKLEENFKKYFQQIHGNVTSGSNGQALKDRYNDDTDKNYYKLREDWWTANRETVWEAITCSDDLKGASYFRSTCKSSGGGISETREQARDKCRCEKKSGTSGDGDVTIVPTYFDYVPQYLRWFEEWAEDFCRKKKKYVDIVKTYCLDEAKEKYCSLNGYDCTKTKLAVGKYRM